MKRIYLMVIAGIVAVTAAAAAAPLDKKQAGALKRITGEISNNEAALAKFGEGTKEPPSDRVAADYQRKIDKLQQKLAELPGDSDEVKRARAQLAKLQALLATKIAQRATFVNPADLARMDGEIGDAETLLATYGEGAQWGILTERVEKQQLGRLQALRDSLAAMPADRADVNKVRAHLKKADALLAAKIAERTAKVKAGADAEAAIVALVTGATFEADLKALTAMARMFQQHRSYALDHYHFGRWVDHDDNKAMAAWGAGWAQTQRDFVALRATYAKAIDGALVGGQPGFAQIKLKEVLGKRAAEDFEEFKAAVAAFVAAAPAQVDADSKELATLIETAASKGEFGRILDPDGRIQNLRNRLVNLPSAYGPLVTPAERAKVDARAKAAEAKAVERIAVLTDQLVASNRAPDDTYEGKERKTLTAFITRVWKEEFPGEEILAIRLREPAFTRTEEWVKDPNTGSQSKRDESRLPITVVVKGSGKEAIMWFGVLRRDHMKGDAMELVAVMRTKSQPTPMQRMLQANLK